MLRLQILKSYLQYITLRTAQRPDVGKRPLKLIRVHRSFIVTVAYDNLDVRGSCRS